MLGENILKKFIRQKGICNTQLPYETPKTHLPLLPWKGQKLIFSSVDMEEV
jgi:hypothetical protein